MKICPSCHLRINPDDSQEVAGNDTYHAGCWEIIEEEMENANLQDFDEPL